jgi:hypothetical protein
MRALLALRAVALISPVLAAAMAGFVIVSLSGGGVARAEPGEHVDTLGDARCLTHRVPSGELRTTCFEGDPPEPFWWRSLADEDDARPRFDQVVNGFTIGPNVQTASSALCEAAGVSSEFALPEDARGTDADFTPRYLPAEAELVSGEALACGGTIVGLMRTYWVPPDLSIPRWGGYVDIVKSLTAEPVLHSDGPAARIKAAEVAGRPAVIVEPLTADGFGYSMLAIRDDGRHIIVIYANGITARDLVLIGEGLY